MMKLMILCLQWHTGVDQTRAEFYPRSLVWWEIPSQNSQGKVRANSVTPNVDQCCYSNIWCQVFTANHIFHIWGLSVSLSLTHTHTHFNYLIGGVSFIIVEIATKDHARIDNDDNLGNNVNYFRWDYQFDLHDNLFLLFF